MGLDKNQGLQQNAEKTNNTGSKEKSTQSVYALGMSNGAKDQHPIPFPWNCIKDYLYPESNHLCNIKNMGLHEQVNIIRTYISSVFTVKNKSKK